MMLKKSLVTPYGIFVKALHLYKKYFFSVSTIYALTVLPSLALTFIIVSYRDSLMEKYTLTTIVYILCLSFLLVFVECLSHISIVYVYKSRKKILPLKIMYLNLGSNLAYVAQLHILVFLSLLLTPTILAPLILLPLILVQAPVTLSNTKNPIKNLLIAWSLVKNRKYFFYKSFLVITILILGWVGFLYFIDNIFWLKTIFGLVTSICLMPIIITYGYCLFQTLEHDSNI